MLTIVVTMLVIVVLAVLVVAYVAFPHRGRDIPQASWLSNATTKTVDKVAPDRADSTASEPAPTRGARSGSNSA
jgi:hypothetical protein